MFGSGLGPHHRNHILQKMLGIQRELSELEADIAMASDLSPFARLVNDLSPAEANTIRDHFNRIRRALQANLQHLGIPLEVRKTSLRWALEATLVHLQVLIDDLNPRALAAYGPLAPDAGQAILGVQADLRRLLEQLLTVVHAKSVRHLTERLEQLGTRSADAVTLAQLQMISSRWGLVEFLPTIERISERMQNPCFEIAFFGRVSSGKSSLLNRITGCDVLPIGVTPVTAVPTRISAGRTAGALVRFTDTRDLAIPVERLGEFVTEQGNPGNHKHVADVLVQLPSERLKEGVVLVDTPGVGSLALAGSAAAVAYLPRCDLGVVLIDAGSALMAEDLALVRSLLEAGAPPMVLLSKADLVNASDRERLIEYTGSFLSDEFGIDLNVVPVSTVAAHESLLEAWYVTHVRPLLESHASLAKASIARKVGLAREAVLGSLLAIRDYGGASRGETAKAECVPAVEQALAQAEAAIQEARQLCLEWGDLRIGLVEYVIQESAAEVVSESPTGAPSQGDSLISRVIRQLMVRRGCEAAAAATRLWEQLVWSLETIADSSAPVAAGIDLGGIQEARPSGLPAPSVAPIQGERIGRPFWSRWARKLALDRVADRIDQMHGAAIRAAVDYEDRRVQSWLKGTVDQLCGIYESQAAVMREILRRLALPSTGESGGAADAHSELLADIAALSAPPQTDGASP